MFNKLSVPTSCYTFPLIFFDKVEITDILCMKAYVGL